MAAPTLQVSPASVKAGGSLTISGTAPKACKAGTKVTLESFAFKGGIPFNGHTFKYAKVKTAIKHGGKFSQKVTIPKDRKAARYFVRALCGTAGNFGGTRFFFVTKP